MHCSNSAKAGIEQQTGILNELPGWDLESSVFARI